MTTGFKLDSNGQKITCRDYLVTEIVIRCQRTDEEYMVIFSPDVRRDPNRHKVETRCGLLDQAWPGHPAVDTDGRDFFIGPVSQDTDIAMLHALLGVIRSIDSETYWPWQNDLIALRMLNILNPSGKTEQPKPIGPTNLLLRHTPALLLFGLCREHDFGWGLNRAEWAVINPAYTLMIDNPELPPKEVLISNKHRWRPHQLRSASWYELIKYYRNTYMTWETDLRHRHPFGNYSPSSLLALHQLQEEANK